MNEDIENGGEKQGPDSAEPRGLRLSDDLKLDLLGGIETGRQIVREETANFFENYKVPEINLGASLKTTLAEAQGLVGGFKSASASVREGQEKAAESNQKKLRALQGEISGLKQIIQRIEDQQSVIAAEANAGDPPDVKARHKAKLLALQKEAAKYEGQLAAKTIEFEILKTSVQ